MIQTQDIMKCLPLLASVLGDRYGVTVEIGGTEAYTDGKSIHIPAMPQEADATVLALVRAYVDHESAHIRGTDFTCLRNAQLTPFEKHIWNIIEDWRVEHKLSAIFPGCRQNFNWMIHHLFTDTSAPVTRAEEKSSALSVLKYSLTGYRFVCVKEALI